MNSPPATGRRVRVDTPDDFDDEEEGEGEWASPTLEELEEGGVDTEVSEARWPLHTLMEGGEGEEAGAEEEEEEEEEANALRSVPSRYRRLESNPFVRAREAREYSDISYHLDKPLVLVMVGLPARGKSYIGKMLHRYLTWIGLTVEIFNVGSYRRKIGLAGVDSQFFDVGNKEAKEKREQLATLVQIDMYQWLLEVDENHQRKVAIFDATNTTVLRRQALMEKAREHEVFLLFIESICTAQDILKRNYTLKLQNDDYKDSDPNIALEDFKARVRQYERVYETIEDWEDDGQVAYIKLYNVGQKTVTQNCRGYLASQVAFYMQNIHINPRKIWLSLYAENDDHRNGIYGGDSGALTEAGRSYSLNLTQFMREQRELHEIDMATDPTSDGGSDGGGGDGGGDSSVGDGHDGQIDEILVLVGTQRVHLETIAHLQLVFPCVETAVLNEIFCGDMQGYTMAQMEQLFPAEYQARRANKLHYRYPGPGGESYVDVIERIRPIIIELERQRRSVLVVCHLAVARCILGYFTNTPMEQIPHMEIPMHTVVELAPGPFDTDVIHHPLGDEHRDSVL